MARYSDIKPSGYAWKELELPLANVPHGLQKGTPEQRAQWEKDGKPKPLRVGIRALSPEEDLLAHEYASAYSAKHGVDEFVETNPICVLALQHYTLAMACVDPASDPYRPLLFFGDSVEEAADNLRCDPKHCITPDTVAYLYERYQVWRDQINPQALSLGDLSLHAAAEKAADDADFLLALRPGALLTFTATLAVQHVTLAAKISGASTTSKSGTIATSAKPRKPLAKTKGKRLR